MCDMVSSYLDNVDYGYDQINVGSSEINDVFKTLDTNSITNIDTIRERELRMFNKLNSYKPPPGSPSYNYCSPNLFNATGVQKVQERHNVKENIENYYYGSGNNLKNQLNYPQSNTQATSEYPQTFYQTQFPQSSVRPIPNDKMFKYFPTEYNFALEQRQKRYTKKQKNKKTNTELFQNDLYEDQNEVEYLQEEMDTMEQKNNLLIVFIFFLVIIVLVQYAKSNNNPIQVMLIPSKEFTKETLVNSSDKVSSDK
jgi:hypothetical protein